MADAWDANFEGLEELLSSVNASMFWMGDAHLPPDLAQEEEWPPKPISLLSLAVVPQGDLGFGVCSLFFL